MFKNKLIPLLQGHNLVESINYSTFTVKFKSGSILQFQSAENYEGLRGATLTHLICDEFAFFRPEAYEYALSPMMAVKGEMTIFVSTPKGLNTFYKYWELGADEFNESWESFISLYHETGNKNLIANIEESRLYMPPEMFRQEFEAAFVSDGGSVFKDVSKAFCLADWGEANSLLLAGIDLGQTHDRTVIAVLNKSCELVFFKRFELKEQVDAPMLVKNIHGVIGKFKNILATVEKNFNPAVYDYLFKISSLYTKWTTNNDNKVKMISNLQFYISSGMLKIPDNPETEQLKKELLDYELRYTKNGKSYAFSAPNGGFDDCVIALALACWKHKVKYGIKTKTLLLT